MSNKLHGCVYEARWGPRWYPASQGWWQQMSHTWSGPDIVGWSWRPLRCYLIHLVSHPYYTLGWADSVALWLSDAVSQSWSLQRGQWHHCPEQCLLWGFHLYQGSAWILEAQKSSGLGSKPQCNVQVVVSPSWDLFKNDFKVVGRLIWLQNHSRWYQLKK